MYVYLYASAYLYMHVNMYYVCKYVCTCVYKCVYSLRKVKRDIGSPGTWVTDSCEPPSECWEPNQESGQKQQVCSPPRNLSFLSHSVLPGLHETLPILLKGEKKGKETKLQIWIPPFFNFGAQKQNLKMGFERKLRSFTKIPNHLDTFEHTQNHT